MDLPEKGEANHFTMLNGVCYNTALPTPSTVRADCICQTKSEQRLTGMDLSWSLYTKQRERQCTEVKIDPRDMGNFYVGKQNKPYCKSTDSRTRS